ncbi:EamA family transporter [Moraxella bovis]|uniref:EamA family transporter n=1 Tax=Moraxella bovis TaxID=476 RepID=UPI0022273A8C|nr:EamA family transporter [Moraxella bovis]UZA42087.1 EamA family transporter [Moraxella bovis]
MAWYFGFTPVSLASLPYIVGIGVTALAGQLLMTYAHQVGQKFVVAVLNYLGVVFAMMFGVMWLGERLDTWALLGIVIIVASGIINAKK